MLTVEYALSREQDLIGYTGSNPVLTTKIKKMEEEKLIHLLFLSETREQLGRELEGESDEEIQIEREKGK